MPESERPTIECVSTLLPTSWPSTVSSEYGENELRLACSKFLFPYTNDLKHEYRDFKDMKGAEVSGRKIRRLFGAIHTLPVSTAECECGFSKMNLICTPLRSCIRVEHMSSLLFISIVGPPLREWNLLPNRFRQVQGTENVQSHISTHGSMEMFLSHQIN